MSESRMKRIERILLEAFKPEHLQILDESHSHSGQGQETHLRVVVVTPMFQGLSRVVRQQKIYAMINTELQTGLHALALRTLTPEEWAQEGGVDRSQSPPCLGGKED